MMRPLRLALLALAIIGFSGCASISISDSVRSPKITLKQPKKIYVIDFEVPNRVLQVDRSHLDLEKFQKTLSDDLSKHLVQRLDKRVLPAERAKSLASLPQGPAWAVTGRFENVRQGSRLLRILVGIGEGKTTLETFVVVHDLSGKTPRAFFSFRTGGGSNMEGGAVFPLVTGAPLAAGFSVIGGVSAGLSVDTKRTARQITAAISEEVDRNHLKTRKRVMHPKYKEMPPPLQLPTWVP
ncbi:MAG: DUF4410 domain-containing protein [Chthoniobacterales bacterium]